MFEKIQYDDATGKMFWLHSNNRRIRVGDPVGSVRADGYIEIGYDGKKYLAHQIAWAKHHKTLPTLMIDHINGNRSDNRIANLREATKSINAQNQKRAKRNNKVGLLGVSLEKKIGRYISQINIDGKRVWGGRFDNAEQAHFAYLERKRVLHPACTI